MRKWLFWLVLLPGWLRAEPALFSADSLTGGHWRTEAAESTLLDFDEGESLAFTNKTGITVWFRHRLTAPVTISYKAKVRSTGRVSDLNCFWMATDPAQPDGNLFVPGRTRDGAFASYDSLRTYYVGYGGNNNTTTRFRRYDGTGARPLLPQHDLSAPEFLLKPDHLYHITLTVDQAGRVQFIRDGETVFDWVDPEPLRSGWFGFRSVDSQIEIRDFQVHSGVPAGSDGR